MFVAANGPWLQYLFLFGFWYTVSNIIVFIINNKTESSEKSNNKFIWLKYIIHLTLTIAFFYFLENKYHPLSYLWLSITAVIVTGLWFFIHKKTHNNSDQTPPTNTAIDTLIGQIKVMQKKLKSKG